MTLSTSLNPRAVLKHESMVIGLLLASLLALTWALLGPGVSTPADEPKTPAKETPEAAVLGQTRVHEFHLEFSAREWERLQMVVGGMRFPGARGNAPKPADKPAEQPGEE